jgi:hypothetical protein
VFTDNEMQAFVASHEHLIPNGLKRRKLPSAKETI